MPLPRSECTARSPRSVPPRNYCWLSSRGCLLTLQIIPVTYSRCSRISCIVDNNPCNLVCLLLRSGIWIRCQKLHINIRLWCIHCFRIHLIILIGKNPGLFIFIISMNTSTIPRIRKPSRIFRWVFLFFFVVLRVLLFLFLFICTFFAPPFSDPRIALGILAARHL